MSFKSVASDMKEGESSTDINAWTVEAETMSVCEAVWINRGFTRPGSKSL